MNSPPAPLSNWLSMSLRVLTFSFLSIFSVKIRIDKEFDFIVATITEKTFSIGEIDVNLFFQLPQPDFQTLVTRDQFRHNFH